MFSRIRYAAHVLSSPRVDPYEHADIGFEEEQPVVVSRVSRAIGGLIEILVVTFAAGVIAAPLITRLWPLHTTANAGETMAVVASIVTLLAVQCFERFKAEVGKHLKIGEKVAPYFGNRIVRTFRILRG